jgi:hypothetical protein
MFNAQHAGLLSEMKDARNADLPSQKRQLCARCLTNVGTVDICCWVAKIFEIQISKEKYIFQIFKFMQLVNYGEQLFKYVISHFSLNPHFTFQTN